MNDRRWPHEIAKGRWKRFLPAEWHNLTPVDLRFMGYALIVVVLFVVVLIQHGRGVL